MLKFKYEIDPGAFSSMEAYNAYLNRMGEKGYELVSYMKVDRAYLAFTFDMHPRKGLLYFITNWKIETPE